MTLLQDLLIKIKSQPRLVKKASVKTLEQYLNEQEKKRIEKQKKAMKKAYNKAKKNIVKATPPSKKKKSPVKLELTKAQKALHKKVYGAKKTQNTSPY
jgi:putative cell wall-binding protein